ncbi:MAG: aspartate/methionine/tyrosine aminotransferase [Arenicella sp.]|jgi:aspartate/methionine/tyrosine aminotransferase
MNNTTTPFNPVFEGLVPSSTLYINEAVNQLWRQGEQAFHMGFGESRFDVHPRLKASLIDNANKKSYLPARGLPELIDSVASYYTSKLNTPFSPSQVIVGPGSKSLIFGLQMVMNADLFLPTPSWVSYAPQAQLLGNKVSYIPSSVEDNYQLDIDALDVLVKKSDNPCKLLIINSPNNPTGEVMSDDFLRQLAAYCRANDIWVLSDEIYFQVCHGDVEHVSIAKYYPERTFVFGGLSKHLSIGGWRVGVALFPDTELGQQLLQKMVVFASETWSGVSAPIQYAATSAYQQHDDVERYVVDCCAIHGIRTRFIKDKLIDLGVHCTGAQGGFYIAANFDSFRSGLSKLGITTSAQLASHLLDEYHIATLPGSDFGIPADTHTLRLSTSYLDMETEFDSQRLYDLYNGGLRSKSLMGIDNHPVTQAALFAFAQFIKTIS